MCFDIFPRPLPPPRNGAHEGATGVMQSRLRGALPISDGLESPQFSGAPSGSSGGVQRETGAGDHSHCNNRHSPSPVAPVRRAAEVKTWRNRVVTLFLCCPRNGKRLQGRATMPLWAIQAVCQAGAHGKAARQVRKPGYRPWNANGVSARGGYSVVEVHSGYSLLWIFLPKTCARWVHTMQGASS